MRAVMRIDCAYERRYGHLNSYVVGFVLDETPGGLADGPDTAAARRRGEAGAGHGRASAVKGTLPFRTPRLALGTSL